jgi:phenylalanyl-tRNA synthetase alpha chain
MSPEDRREIGRLTNEAFTALREALEARSAELEEGADAVLLEADAVDVTLPGRRPRPGSLHPLTLVERRLVEVFTRMGYRVAEGPEIEDDWHNFEALNIPRDHPARTMKDSLYVDLPGLLLRTETSAVQIRTMESQEPPVFIVAPGRTYRRETPDATHGSVFHQVEGLAVDEGISFADLRGTLEAFARELFGERTRVRMTPRLLPVRRAGLPGRRLVLRVRRRRLPRVRQRVDRAARRGDGPPEGPGELRI